jgi:hypothetical protein
MIRTFRPLWLPLLGAALLTACDTAAPGALDDAMRLGDARLGPLAEQGHISVTLGDGKDDPTVIEDARSILVGALDNMAALDFAAGHHVSVTYLGKGKVAPRGAEVDEGPAPEGAAAREPGAHVEGIDAINLATKNEFRIVFGGGLLAAVGERDARLGLDRGTPADQEPMPRPIVPEGVVFTITSNGDDRTRTYGVNADVTNAVHRRLVQLGSGCSGTLVGPPGALVLHAGPVPLDRRQQHLGLRLRHPHDPGPPRRHGRLDGPRGLQLELAGGRVRVPPRLPGLLGHVQRPAPHRRAEPVQRQPPVRQHQ